MTASSGWDRLPHPAPQPEPAPHDQTGEPVGYNLGNVQFEQPPMPVVPPAATYAPAPPLPAKEATAGFVLSLVGLAATPFLPIFTFALVASGLVLSASSLRECRRGVAGGRGRAIAGVVLGILGVVLTVVVLLDFMTGYATISPT